MNPHLKRNNQALFCEGVELSHIAQQFGTPVYVYSKKQLLANWHAYNDALTAIPHLICYSVKANSNLSILNTLSKEGSGFDVVSLGELERCLKINADPQKIVFSGVAKRADEIERALQVGVLSLNIESSAELERVHDIAKRLGIQAPISLRVNPDVDAKTHPYITTGLQENKFGIDINLALALYQKAAKMPYLKIVGVDCHIGSQLTQIEPLLNALDRILLLIEQLKKYHIHPTHINMGGGLGIAYEQESIPSVRELCQAYINKLKQHNITFILEPGRSIVGDTGVLLTEVLYLKQQGNKNFAIVDAGMNDQMRPALYGAHHDIINCQLSTSHEASYDIVGPVCETADFLGKERKLTLKQGDILAMLDVGAYGASMSSHYNSRPSAAEVFVEDKKAYLIRKRDQLETLFENEIIL